MALKILVGLTLADARLLTGKAKLPTYSPTGLLHYLETFYALGAPTVNRAALRTEQYRQVLTEHFAGCKQPPFYAKTFAADQFATAEELLSRRDELLEAGWKLSGPVTSEVPERLRVTLELEQILLDDRNSFNLLPGNADRLRELIAALPEDRHPRLDVLLNEPREDMPAGFQQLLLALEKSGDIISPIPAPAAAPLTTDLGRWQAKLRGEATSDAPLAGDGSLVILRAQRETHITAYLARTLRKNSDWRPSVLLSTRNQTLDNSLIAEGLPSMGVPSTSLARPSLQVLKLVTVFLWEPIEVERIMEFVSLVNKPLHWRLAQRIAFFLADTPGMFGPRWRGMIESFFRKMESERNWSAQKLKAVRDQYKIWFERKRYGRNEEVPKLQLRFLFLQLREWALEERNELRKEDLRKERIPGDYGGLLVLYAQAQRAVELLDAQPEAGLNYLAVERLVRTVYEPAPAQFQAEEQGALDAIFSPASALQLPGEEPIKQLIWVDFVENEPDYFFSRYYPPELEFLKEQGVIIDGPEKKNKLAIWQQRRPVFQAGQQLVLCLPDRVDGAEAEPHSLLGDLEAAFAEGSLKKITVEIDKADQAGALADLTSPSFVSVPVDPLAGPTPLLPLERLKQMPEREAESPTSLENLLFYPYKYVFRHGLQLKGTPILSIASAGRLRGNLAHRMIEQLLRYLDNDRAKMTMASVHQWIEENNERLFRHQGAVLLQYGQEPEKIQFVRTMKKAAWALVYLIRENGWTVRGSEEPVYGELEPMGQRVRGFADLTLERTRNGKVEAAVVDLKWQGKTAFQNMLKNGRDVQLAIYGSCVADNQMQNEEGNTLHENPDTVHTAYFLIRFGKLLSRNQLAFAQAEVEGDPGAEAVQADTMRRIRNTLNWRWGQFREGVLEIRCAETAGHLEEAYLDKSWEDFFELEPADARFDDYRPLIGLVR